MDEIGIPETGASIGMGCVSFALRRVSRAVTRDYDDALRPLNLKVGQFSILSALRRPYPLPVSDLASELGMDRTTMSKDIKPLERRGLLETRKDPEDARVRLVSLSRKGEDLWRKAYPLWQQAQKKIHARLGKTDWTALRAELLKLEGRV